MTQEVPDRDVRLNRSAGEVARENHLAKRAAVRHAATATPEDWQRNGDPDRRVDELVEMEVEGGGRVTVRVVRNVEGDPLRLYRRRGWLAPGDAPLNERRFRAGDALRIDYGAAFSRPRVVGGYQDPAASGGSGAGGDAYAVRSVSAYKRFRSAIGRLDDRARAAVLRAACYDEPVGKGRAMADLRRGLDALAGTYGL